MSTDLLTQLAEYGAHHRQSQEPVKPGEVKHTAVRPMARPSYAMRRAGAALFAAALVMVMLAIPALLRGPEGEGPAESVMNPTPLEVPSTTASTVETPSTTGSTVALEGGPDGFTMVHTLEDGSLIALSQRNVWRSTDSGETWEEWYTQEHEIDLLAVAPDGAVLAVRNPNASSEASGPDSSVNDTPEVHRYDPMTGGWAVIALPRPELPRSDLQPATMDPAESTCPLGGLHSRVDGIAVAVSEKIVILGDHRVVADGICDGNFQFLWTSADGLQWQLIPSVGIDGYLAGIVRHGAGYVGYGSPRPWFAGSGGPTPQVWSTTDLATWTEAALDTSAFPEDGFVYVVPAAGFGGSGSPRVDGGPGGLTLTFEVMRPLSGLDSTTDLAGLLEWVTRAGWSEVAAEELEGQLELIDVDFPLDNAEIDELRSFLGPFTEPYGTLTLTSGDGIDWETVYTP